MSYISIKNLTYKYPTSKQDILTDINLEIEKGKLYSLIGGNGSGKTTLCNAIRGYIPHFYKGKLQGELLIQGKDIREWEMGDLAKQIGFVFQNPFTQISGIKDTVFEEIAYGLENLGVDVPTIREKVEWVLDLLNIQHLRDNNPNEMSGGQKQRVAFASIIVMEPDILVIDEPTSQLDPDGTEEIFKIIEILKNSGKTIILVEHKIELIAQYSDYIVLLKDGQIKMQGKTKDVLSDSTVLDHDGALPQYSHLGLELKKNQEGIHKIPITEDEAISLISNLLRKKGVTA
ncbi:ABC transporter ATP-binding protein [Bacillus sp. B15-48]|uniref:energy-coupling factor ABC transporter ATP-binding protein n=1 Tax=Bacillus sp. B15-48 TaxID=1548601 RepID=UPI00193ED38B|nr:ABC transporter ATP-binding protein [Bacillus sp. B15-48]MBM4761243.1 ATP-binding cassette domain-containing protein [Bacillus sp. B15-48]